MVMYIKYLYQNEGPCLFRQRHHCGRSSRRASGYWHVSLATLKPLLSKYFKQHSTNHSGSNRYDSQSLMKSSRRRSDMPFRNMDIYRGGWNETWGNSNLCKIEAYWQVVVMVEWKAVTERVLASRDGAYRGGQQARQGWIPTIMKRSRHFPNLEGDWIQSCVFLFRTFKGFTRSLEAFAPNAASALTCILVFL